MKRAQILWTNRARCQSVDVLRRRQHVGISTPTTAQLTRFANSHLVTRTPRGRLLSQTTKPLSSAFARAPFCSQASGGHQIDPVFSVERTILPDELSRNVVVLTCDSADGRPCHVYLVGTIHVSQESCREVRDVINFVKPQVVFLELCASRKAALTLRSFKVPTMSEMVDSWKKKRNLFGIAYSWFLAKVAEELGVIPGSEFRVGYEEAGKCGSKVFLGDRPVNVTLLRTWRKMPLWHKNKLLYSFFRQALAFRSPEVFKDMGAAHVRLEDLNDNDMVTKLLQDMSKNFPTLIETIVDERDQYMSSTLLRIASYHHSVVAVVGRGHLQGIKKYWLQPIDVDKLMEIPSTSASTSATKMCKSLGVAGLGVAIATGIYLAAKM